MKTNHLKLVKLYSDNHEGTVMSEAQYKEETLSMSTGDFHTHKTIPVSKEESKIPAKAKTAQCWNNECLKKKRVWEKAEINAVIKMLNSKNYERNMITREAINTLEINSAYGKLEHSITKEQSKFGIEYLLNRYFKKTGEARKNCPFGTREERILKSFKKFTFIGFYAVHNNYGDMRWMLPVYRVYSKNGDHFDYSPVHWGTPIVHN